LRGKEEESKGKKERHRFSTYKSVPVRERTHKELFLTGRKKVRGGKEFSGSGIKRMSGMKER